MTKFHRGELETLEDYSEWFGVSADASYEEIDRVYNDYNRENIENGGVIRLREGGRFCSSNDPLNSPEMRNHPITIVYKILKNKKKCSGCDKFMLGREVFCSSQCSELYRVKTSAMQEINNKFRDTNLDPRLESQITHEFLGLFNSCLNRGPEESCEHVPFTRQCNDVPSIQQSIWRHMTDCLKTQTEVENFKVRVINAIERETLNQPVNASPNLWGHWNPPSIPRSDNNTSNHANNYENSLSSNYSSNSSSSTSSETYSSQSQESNSSSYSSTTNSANTNNSSESKASSLASSTGSFSGGEIFSAPSGGGGGSSASAMEDKPKNQATSPTSGQSEVPFVSPKSNEPSNLVSQEKLSKQKQQIRQVIQAKLDQLPDLKSLPDFVNWKQEVEQITNLKTLAAYQKNLLERIEKEKQQFHSANVLDPIPNQNKSWVGWIMGIIILSLVGVGLSMLWWERKSRQ